MTSHIGMDYESWSFYHERIIVKAFDDDTSFPDIIGIESRARPWNVQQSRYLTWHSTQGRDEVSFSQS